MISLMHRFAALTLILAVIHALLPEGAMRRTALMCAGLLLALCYLDALPTVELPLNVAEPGSVLSVTEASAGDLTAAMEVYTRQAERFPQEE